jgi:hypothetical protein
MTMNTEKILLPTERHRKKVWNGNRWPKKEWRKHSPTRIKFSLIPSGKWKNIWIPTPMTKKNSRKRYLDIDAFSMHSAILLNALQSRIVVYPRGSFAVEST